MTKIWTPEIHSTSPGGRRCDHIDTYVGDLMFMREKGRWYLQARLLIWTSAVTKMDRIHHK